MITRSSSSPNLISPLPNPENLIRNRSRATSIDNMANLNGQIPPVDVNVNGGQQGPNLQSMEEMLQAPFDGVR